MRELGRSMEFMINSPEATTHRLDKNRIIFREGARNPDNDTLYCVTDGIIGLERLEPKIIGAARGKMVAVKRQGDIFGFEDFGSDIRSTTARCLTPSTIVEVQLDLTDPVLQADLLRKYAEYVRDAIEHVSQSPFTNKSRGENVKRTLVELAIDDTVLVDHTTIGRRSGGSRERVEDHLKELRRTGIIKQAAPEEIVILDPEGLKYSA